MPRLLSPAGRLGSLDRLVGGDADRGKLRLAMNRKVALITGITGQDGAYLAEFLLAKGYVVHALPLLDKAIDRALMDGCSQIHVVHGHGTGRLRKAVQDFLSDHSVVKGFHPEKQNAGGTGVTVVELKD